MAQQSASRADRYREKAEEARVMAEGMHGGSARDTILEVAATWDRLADQEENNRTTMWSKPNPKAADA